MLLKENLLNWDFIHLAIRQTICTVNFCKIFFLSHKICLKSNLSSYLTMFILFRWCWCCRSFILCSFKAVVGHKKVSTFYAYCSIYYVCYVSKYTLLLILNYFILFPFTSRIIYHLTYKIKFAFKILFTGCNYLYFIIFSTNYRTI